MVGKEFTIDESIRCAGVVPCDEILGTLDFHQQVAEGDTHGGFHGNVLEREFHLAAVGRERVASCLSLGRIGKGGRERGRDREGRREGEREMEREIKGGRE